MQSTNKPTPVLNLGTNKMVLIQMDSPIVVNQACIRHSDEGEVFVITGEKYQELVNNTYMPKADEDLTKRFIIDRFKNNTHMGLYILSDEAYDFIYNSLPANFKVQEVLDIYETLYGWHEHTASEVLKRLNIEHAHLSDEEQQILADDLLSNSNLEFYQNLEVDGEAVFLYKGNLHELSKGKNGTE